MEKVKWMTQWENKQAETHERKNREEFKREESNVNGENMRDKRRGRSG